MNAESIGEILGGLIFYLIPTFIGTYRQVVNPLFAILWISNLATAAAMIFLPEDYATLRGISVVVWFLSFGLAFNRNRRPGRQAP